MIGIGHKYLQRKSWSASTFHGFHLSFFHTQSHSLALKLCFQICAPPSAQKSSQAPLSPTPKTTPSPIPQRRHCRTYHPRTTHTQSPYTISCALHIYPLRRTLHSCVTHAHHFLEDHYIKQCEPYLDPISVSHSLCFPCPGIGTAGTSAPRSPTQETYSQPRS